MVDARRESGRAWIVVCGQAGRASLASGCSGDAGCLLVGSCAVARARWMETVGQDILGRRGLGSDAAQAAWMLARNLVEPGSQVAGQDGRAAGSMLE